VYVIESKDYTGQLTVGGGEIRVAGSHSRFVTTRSRIVAPWARGGRQNQSLNADREAWTFTGDRTAEVTSLDCVIRHLRGLPASSSATMRASSARELIASLAKMCRRWLFTVCGERKSRSAISRLVIPSETSLATCVSAPVNEANPLP